jgi:hypothetical protein
MGLRGGDQHGAIGWFATMIETERWRPKTESQFNAAERAVIVISSSRAFTDSFDPAEMPETIDFSRPNN